MMPGWIVVVMAGLLVGFGTRLGNGCTSGHGICGIARLDRYRVFHRLLIPPARIIIENGAYVQRALKSEGVDLDVVETAMREHGVTDVSQVRLGVLEPDGSISIGGRCEG